MVITMEVESRTRNCERAAPAQLLHFLVQHASKAVARYDLPIVQLHLVVQPLPHLRTRAQPTHSKQLVSTDPHNASLADQMEPKQPLPDTPVESEVHGWC